MKYFFTITSICFLSFSLSFGQIIRNVPSQYPTIQSAINASINGDTILVQPGTYVERINFNGKAIVVTSTSILSNDTSLISSTIIDGNYLPNVVTFNNNEGSNSKLIGFTIQNGFYNGGSNVYNGAGILVDGASPEISNCIVRNNYISWYGGGICIKNGSAAFLNSLIISNNHSEHHGGGIAILSAQPILTNLIIHSNSTGELGGGIYISSIPLVEIINCTITENSATGYSGHYGGGISTTAGSNIIVMNSIIWNNVPNQIDDEFGQTKIVQYSNVQNGYPGTGNINDNPKFISASSKNFRISDYSPSIGAGVDSLFYSGIWYKSPEKDIDLNPRPNPIGSNPDQGAFENSFDTPQHKTLVQVPGDYATIQSAIDGVIDGDTILVLPGNYVENINFNNKNILLTSNALFNRDSLIVNQTKIIAQNVLQPAINIPFNGRGQIIGFSIQGGNDGVHTELYCSTKIDFCKIYNSVGWGISSTSSSIDIINCKIFNNFSGGINLFRSNGSIKLTKIFNNPGPGIYLWENGNLVVIENCLIHNNNIGIGNRYQNPTNITNSTISNNNSGIICVEGSAFTIHNSILFNTGIPITLSSHTGVHILNLDYNIIEGGQNGIVNQSQTTLINYGVNNIDFDPHFIDTSNYNYRLSEFSPAIGSGTSVNIPSIDLDGNPRPNPTGSNPDIGAYESPLAHFELLSPVLSAVPNGAINQPIEVQLSWYPVYGATKYRFQLSTDSTFSNVIIDQANYPDTSIVVSNLAFLTTYFWRVNSSYPYDTSAWSNVWRFKTIIQAPEVPELVSPTNNSFNMQTTQVFVWHTSLRAEVYHLQVSTDSLFSIIIAEDSLITDSTKFISGLNHNTEFYWRVRAKNIGGFSNFSGFFKFRTLLQTPLLQSPTNGSINVSINPTFTWETVPGAAKYHIQLSLNSSFTQIVMEDSLITNNSVQLGPLNNSSTYYWRVRGYYSNYTSLFSNPFIFTTIVSSPNTPNLIAPLNGSVNQPLNTTFIWNIVPSATSYRLQVSIDSLFGSFIIDDSTITTNSRLVNLPNNNQKYFWRVQARNVGGNSEFSNVWHFITILPAPYLSSIQAGNKRIQINWNQIPVANIERTNIYRDIVPNPNNLIASVPVGLNSYIDTGLTNGVIYYYRVKTVSTYGVESEFSNQISSAPFNSQPTAVALNSIFLPNEGRVLTKQLTFSSSGSFDPDGSIDSIKWYVNDEFILVGQDLIYDFPQGTHKVSLIVIDNDGGRDTSIATVTRSMFRNIVNGQVVAGLSLIGDNILYAIVNGDAIYKMDKNGNIDYTLQVGGNLLASSSIANDSSVYIGSTDNNIYAFSKNGTSLWVRALGGAVTSTPTIDMLNNRVYIGVSNRNFQFLDRVTGTVLGNYFSDAPINTSAAITADNKLFFSTIKGTMYGFDLSNITFPNVTPTWSITSTDTISSSPAIDEEGFFYVGTKNGLLKKISMQSGLQGTIVWQANLGGAIVASPVIDASGNIYVGSSNAGFFCIDRTDGHIKWNYSFGGPIKTAAAISNESRIYFGTENGFVYCVDTTGTILWQYKDSTSICNSLLYSDGVLYLGTYGGRLVALYDNAVAGKTTVSVNNIWSTFQGNNQRTGEQGDRIMNIKQDYNSSPTKYILFNNFPNPFNPSTTIKYGLPFDSDVKIEVFNIVGEKVTELINSEQPSGFYEIVFVANDLASGIYIYKISARSVENKNTYQAIKKMILLK